MNFITGSETGNVAEVEQKTQNITSTIDTTTISGDLNVSGGNLDLNNNDIEECKTLTTTNIKPLVGSTINVSSNIDLLDSLGGITHNIDNVNILHVERIRTPVSTPGVAVVFDEPISMEYKDIGNVRTMYADFISGKTGISTGSNFQTYLNFASGLTQFREIKNCYRLNTDVIASTPPASTTQILNSLDFVNQGKPLNIQDPVFDQDAVTNKYFKTRSFAGSYPNVRFINSPDDLTPPLIGNHYILADNTTYFFNKAMTLNFGFQMGSYTAIKGINNATQIKFGQTVPSIFYADNKDFSVYDLYTESGASLMNITDIDIAQGPPYFGRERQIVFNGCVFQRPRSMGTITGGIINLTGCLFTGGSLARPMTITIPGSGFIVGNTYTDINPSGPGTGLAIKVLSVNGTGGILTYIITNTGSNYIIGELAQFSGSNSAIFTVDRVYQGQVNDGTITGLTCISNTNLNILNNRFAIYAGVWQTSSAYLLKVGDDFSPGVSTSFINIGGNTFYPNDSESGVEVSTGATTVTGLISSNLFLGIGNTTNFKYSPAGYYNGYAISNYSINNNTGISSNLPFMSLFGSASPTQPFYPNNGTGQEYYINSNVNNFNFRNAQRFAFKMSVTLSTPTPALEAGYKLVNFVNNAHTLNIIAVEPAVGTSQTIYVNDMTGSFDQNNRSYQIRDRSGGFPSNTVTTYTALGPDGLGNFYFGSSSLSNMAVIDPIPGTYRFDVQVDWASTTIEVNIGFLLKINGATRYAYEDRAEKKSAPVKTQFSCVLNNIKKFDTVSLAIGYLPVTSIVAEISSYNYQVYKLS